MAVAGGAWDADLSGILSEQHVADARRQEARETREAAKLAAEREDRNDRRAWELQHSGRELHSHDEVLAAYAAPDPTERVFVAGHSPTCQCGHCGWTDAPERIEVEDGGTVTEKSLNKFEYFRNCEREAQKTGEQRQTEALAEQVNAQQSWMSQQLQKLWGRKH